MATAMISDCQALLRLMTWLSPAFPVGAFSYSHGLEWTVRSGEVTSSGHVFEWVADVIAQGSGWNDALLLATSWRAAATDDQDELAAISELAEAMSPSVERHMETMLLGEAFARSASPWLDEPLAPAAYPVAIGIVGARNRIPLGDTLAAFLHALASNLVSAAIRLVPLGQSDGLSVIARLEANILDTAKRAEDASLDDLGSACFAADMASLRHQTLEPRLFRS
jgi:urease accessory protein